MKITPEKNYELIRVAGLRYERVCQVLEIEVETPAPEPDPTPEPSGPETKPAPKPKKTAKKG